MAPSSPSPCRSRVLSPSPPLFPSSLLLLSFGSLSVCLSTYLCVYEVCGAVRDELELAAGLLVGWYVPRIYRSRPEGLKKVRIWFDLDADTSFCLGVLWRVLFVSLATLYATTTCILPCSALLQKRVCCYDLCFAELLCHASCFLKHGFVSQQHCYT
jgi:hypothetical protein